MAFEMEAVGIGGFSTDTGYWKLIDFVVSDIDIQASFTFAAWKDKTTSDSYSAARVAGNAPGDELQPIPGTKARKMYHKSGAEYIDIMTKHLTNQPGYENLKSVAYTEARNTKDIDSGQKDTDGKPIMVSAFENAENV